MHVVQERMMAKMMMSPCTLNVVSSIQLFKLLAVLEVTHGWVGF